MVNIEWNIQTIYNHHANKYLLLMIVFHNTNSKSPSPTLCFNIRNVQWWKRSSQNGFAAGNLPHHIFSSSLFSVFFYYKSRHDLFFFYLVSELFSRRALQIFVCVCDEWWGWILNVECVWCVWFTVNCLKLDLMKFRNWIESNIESNRIVSIKMWAIHRVFPFSISISIFDWNRVRVKPMRVKAKRKKKEENVHVQFCRVSIQC